MPRIISTWPMNNENAPSMFGDTIITSSHIKIHFFPPRNRASKMSIGRRWIYNFSKSIEIWPWVIVNSTIDELQVVYKWMLWLKIENSVENDFRKIIDVSKSIEGSFGRIKYYFWFNQPYWWMIIYMDQLLPTGFYVKYPEYESTAFILFQVIRK